MIKLKGGPAAGSYAVTRAPLWLRGVVDSGTGKRDVLDQLDDEPSETETVSVYKRVGEAGHVHLNFGAGKKGGRRTGFYALADYEWLPDADGETVRTTTEWRAWCAIEHSS